MVNLDSLISHRFPLEKTPEALRSTTLYADNVVKIIIDIGK